MVESRLILVAYPKGATRGGSTLAIAVKGQAPFVHTFLEDLRRTDTRQYVRVRDIIYRLAENRPVTNKMVHRCQGDYRSLSEIAGSGTRARVYFFRREAKIVFCDGQVNAKQDKGAQKRGMDRALALMKDYLRQEEGHA